MSLITITASALKNLKLLVKKTEQYYLALMAVVVMVLNTISSQ